MSKRMNTSMRGTSFVVLGCVVFGAVLLPSAGCIPGTRDAGSKACDSIDTQLDRITERRDKRPGDTKAAIQMYENAAASIRVEGRKAGGDIEAAADEIADALWEMADRRRRAMAGIPVDPPRYSLAQSGERLRIACDS